MSIIVNLASIYPIVKRVCLSAITHGIADFVGSVATGLIADLVLWRPENFGSKPEMILKSGVITWAQVTFALLIRVRVANALIQMGDANASIPTVQPVLPRPMWGATPSSAVRNSVCFVSKISIELGKSQPVPFWAYLGRSLLVTLDTRYFPEIPTIQAS